MTRITNFGRKRTYLEAGFHNEGDAVNVEPTGGNATTVAVSAADTALAPSKKVRKGAPKHGRDRSSDEQDDGVKSGDGSNVEFGKGEKWPSGTRTVKSQKTQRRQQAAGGSYDIRVGPSA
jgi:zinc finger CCHC domain-containing protein 9